MKRLVCEMCGGTDLIKQDGVFVCQSCGCKYSVEEARKMMVEVEGTIDVSGSTVKVDTSKKLENLYILARRAKDDNNVQDAAKYYYEIRLEDPNSWEAAFYGVYFGALDCKIGQIGMAASSVANSLNTVAFLILEHVPKEEQKQAYTEMLTRAQHAGKLLYNGAKNHYEDSDYSNAKSDFIDRAAECVALMMGAGKLAEDFFNDFDLAKAIYMDGAKVVRSSYVTGGMASLFDEALQKQKKKHPTISPGSECKKEEYRKFIDQNIIATGDDHTVGLCSDGSVVATSYIRPSQYFSHQGQCDVYNWSDIVSLAAGSHHTVGLRSDGTVVAIGSNESGQCNVSGWNDIVAIAAKDNHTIGLCADGTVVCAGTDSSGLCDVYHWSDIVSIAAGCYHTVGLRSDGTVVATKLTGDLSSIFESGQSNVSSWRDIVAIAASLHTVGLRSNGTVVAVGENGLGQCNVSNWSDITAIAAGGAHTVGLKADGTVVATGGNADKQCDVTRWCDIVAIAAGASCTVGLKSDGTVVAAGANLHGECDVSGWELMISEEQQKKQRARKRAALERERAELPEEQTKLQAELPTLKGLFSGGRRKQIEARLAQIPDRIAEIDSELARIEEELAALG